MKNTAIDIQGLSKQYRIKNQGKTEVFDALKNIDLQIERGQVLGIIGHNGAGKSTLLKILSRITYPTTGRVEVSGRLASLLEVGTGFHPELSGLENIYLNGSILGMKRREIKARLDEIIDFAGTEKFLDTPLKRYSSGMYVRLAFSVAAHLKSDILLIDEVLAVGDAAFQKKCLEKMDTTSREEGRTILFVSHNMNVARNLCEEIILLENGAIRERGEAHAVTEHYLQSMQRSAEQVPVAERSDRQGDGTAKIREVIIKDADSGAKFVTKSGGRVEVEVHYSVLKPGKGKNLQLDLGLINQHGNYLSTLSNRFGDLLVDADHGEGVLRCTVEKWPLMAGRYHLNVHLMVNGFLADRVNHAVEFEVALGDFFGNNNFFNKRIPGVFVEQEWGLEAK